MSQPESRRSGTACCRRPRLARRRRRKSRRICVRRPLTFSMNGPCEVHSGFHSPGVEWTAAATPEAFQFRPQRLVVRMVQVAILDERGADKDSAKGWNFGDAPQLLQREVDILKGQNRGGKQPVRRRLAEIRDPVVVGASQRVGDVGVFDQGKALGEPGRIEKRLVHAHRVHIAQPRLRVPRRLHWPDGGCCGSSSPIASQVIPGRQIAWLGMLHDSRCRGTSRR